MVGHANVIFYHFPFLWFWCSRKTRVSPNLVTIHLSASATIKRVTKPKLKPLKLSSFRSFSKTRKVPRISGPVLISTSNRSLCVPTASSQSIHGGSISQSDTTGGTMIALSQMSSIYTRSQPLFTSMTPLFRNFSRWLIRCIHLY